MWVLVALTLWLSSVHAAADVKEPMGFAEHAKTAASCGDAAGPEMGIELWWDP